MMFLHLDLPGRSRSFMRERYERTRERLYWNPPQVGEEKASRVRERPDAWSRPSKLIRTAGRAQIPMHASKDFGGVGANSEASVPTLIPVTAEILRR